jgi:hypothetical protein
MAAQSSVVSGRVVDDSGAPIANARVSARLSSDASPVEASTNAAGAFQLRVPRDGRYLVTVDRAGYFRLQDRPVDIGAQNAEVTLVLNPQRECSRTSKSATPRRPSTLPKPSVTSS